MEGIKYPEDENCENAKTTTKMAPTARHAHSGIRISWVKVESSEPLEAPSLDFRGVFMMLEGKLRSSREREN